MKKVILCIILLSFVFKVGALECDSSKHKEYVSYADNITYDNNYSKSSKSFNITIYNIIDGMSVKYNDRVYQKNESNIVEINGVSQGSTNIISIFADDGCSEIKIISIDEPYFNTYYGSDSCKGYENKLTMCSSQFTSIKITDSILSTAKKNYDNVIIQDAEEKNIDELSFQDKIIDFLLNWGIKIILLIVTVIISFAFYNSKLRKVKHGI